MSPSKDPLEALRKEYSAALPERLLQIGDAVRNGRDDKDAIELAASLCHRLRGSAGSYGHPRLGKAVGQLEDLLLDMQASTPSDWEGAWDAIEEALLLARACLENEDANGPEAPAPA